MYLVRCSDGTYYCGMAKDVGTRVGAHNSNSRGAKYTRARRPVVLAYQTAPMDYRSAAALERRIKKMSHAQKGLLCALEV